MQLALDIGVENVVEKAHKMGVTSEVETYPSKRDEVTVDGRFSVEDARVKLERLYPAES